MLGEDEASLTKDRQTYHRWMTDPKLQELTASEPLTYEQEVEMQSWAPSFQHLHSFADTFLLFREVERRRG